MCWYSGILFWSFKRWDMDCVEVQGNLFADCQEWHLRLRNFQIRAVPSCKRVELFMLRKRVFRAQTLKYWQCSPAMRLICWCSGSVFSGFQTFRNVQCLPARGLICWFSGNAYSVCETSRNGLCLMKALRFSDTQESCFEAWKSSHMVCSALLCGRLADSQIVFSGLETFKYG